MTPRIKKIVLAVTLFLAVIVGLQSQIDFFNREIPNVKKHEVTKNPLDVFNTARDKHELIFLEFYASW